MKAAAALIGMLVLGYFFDALIDGVAGYALAAITAMQ